MNKIEIYIILCSYQPLVSNSIIKDFQNTNNINIRLQICLEWPNK